MNIVISGPGGVGKGTVVSALIEHDPKLWLSRSWTTRPPRPSETGDAYVFVSREEFTERIEQDGFLEYAEFLGNFYGTPTPDPPAGSDVVLEIEAQGAKQVLVADPDALLILLVAPEGLQQERLRGRGDTEEHVQQRMAKADEEEALSEELNAHRVVNETVDETVTEISSLIDEARSKRAANAAIQQAQQSAQ